MTSKSEGANQGQPGPIVSLWVYGARLTWVILGPCALMVIGAGIISRGTGWTTALDACFGVVVVLMLAGRWVEQRSGAATTMNGEPSTLEHCKQYTIVLLMVAAGVWVGANLLGNHILN